MVRHPHRSEGRGGCATIHRHGGRDTPRRTGRPPRRGLMCGIAGVVRFDGATVEESLLAAMIAELTHRGPDGHGTWVDGAVGFGHRRLSIIDVAGSPQPMASHDDRLHITFNGEILNYADLRRSLSYPFRTNGDTEVLLAAYAARGAAMVEELRGQFAFALHDRSTGEVVLARDHIGILPLYWYCDDAVFAFASEVKALAPALPRTLELDERAVADYLARRAVPAPHTLHRGVRKLRPGHRLHVGADGSVREVRYWDVPGPGARAGDLAPDDAVARLDAALRTSVARNLVADVPVGAYLSGGVDSSLIVALASEIRGGEVATFAADFRAHWQQLAWHRDAPISEPADVAVFRLAQLARQSVKVVLSGEGSDELFAGYPKYRYAPRLRAFGTVPSAVRAPALGALERALPSRADRVRTMVRALAARDGDETIETWFAPFTAAERRRLLPGVEAYGQRDVVATARGDLVRRMLYVDCHAWLSDNLLERGDQMSMAASLELRPPFLDVDV